MIRLRYAALTCLLICLTPHLNSLSAQNQQYQFRGTQAHFGTGIGLFTYHGRINLSDDRSDANFTRSSDPAFVFFGSFPIIRDKLFFRGLMGLSNLNSLGNGGTLSNNEFLNRELFWFEPQVAYTFKPGSLERFIPYAYTGFGTLIADPFGGSSRTIDQPGLGGPGPDRSVFTWPLGLGVDYAFNPRLSLFADASFRINFNYVGRNQGGRNPHNTSLIMFGIRMNLVDVERGTEDIPPVELPSPVDIPPYSPPSPITREPSNQCVLLEMNTLFFTQDSPALSPIMSTLLDENVEALELSPACCAIIEGYTDGADTESEALELSRERATAVFTYYTEQGIASDRLAIRQQGTALPCIKKEDPECTIHKRVESVMVGCNTFPGYRN